MTSIRCSQCNALQDWKAQVVCDYCGRRLNNWSVAVQLMLQVDKLKENKCSDASKSGGVGVDSAGSSGNVKGVGDG